MIEPRYFRFDEAGSNLDFVPLAARRALDHIGAKLSLEGWRSLSESDRKQLCTLGSDSTIAKQDAQLIVLRASPSPRAIEPVGDPPNDIIPEQVVVRFESDLQVSVEDWAKLEPIERFALLKAAQSKKTDAFRHAYHELARKSPELTHLTHNGEACMVSTIDKPLTKRRAVAESVVNFSRDAQRCLIEGNAAKGDVIGTARVAAILAAKHTSTLIPLCHPVRVTCVDVQFDISRESPLVRITASVEALDRTGVEMEALTAAAVAALTIYDMLKAVDRAMVIGPTLLIEKSGGRSGVFHR